MIKNTPESLQYIIWSSIDSSSIFNPIISNLKNKGYTIRHEYYLNNNFHKNKKLFSRFRYRFGTYIVYPFWLAFKIFSSNSGIHIVTTNPFFAPSLAVVFKRKFSSIIALHWDIFPEALDVAGVVSKNTLFYKFLDKLQSIAYLNADSNVFLGKIILENIHNKFSNLKNPIVIPVGSSFVPDFSPIAGIEKPKFPINICYSGNLGLMHDISTFVNFIEYTNKKKYNFKNINFIFQSHGIRHNQLLNYFYNNYSDVDIKFTGFLSNIDWCNTMRSMDISLVTMEPGAENVVFPSKVFSALAFGQAILAICPLKSDLSNFVLENEIGWVIEPGDSINLFNLLEAISNSEDLISIKRMNSSKLFSESASTDSISKLWSALFNSLQKSII